MADRQSKQADCDNANTELREGLARIHVLRDSIAKFLAKHEEDVDNLMECCDRNGWEAGVAFSFRVALFQLGCVLSTLVLWDNEVLEDYKGSDVEKLLADVRRLEAGYARESR